MSLALFDLADSPFKFAHMSGAEEDIVFTVVSGYVLSLPARHFASSAESIFSASYWCYLNLH